MCGLLPRDATQSAVMKIACRLSVRHGVQAEKTRFLVKDFRF